MSVYANLESIESSISGTITHTLTRKSRQIILTNDSGVVDISTATTKDFIFNSSNRNNPLTVNSSFVTDGTDGKIKYTTVEDDLLYDGEYKLQAHIEMPSGSWKTNKYKFYVESNLS